MSTFGIKKNMRILNKNAKFDAKLLNLGLIQLNLEEKIVEFGINRLIWDQKLDMESK